MADKTYIQYAHWRETKTYSVVILWSDHTWEEMNFGDRFYKKIDGETVSLRAYINIKYPINTKMEKDKALEYINSKFVEFMEIQE